MSDGSGDSGLDSFGRVIETLWKKGPDVMQKASYGYDRALNRKWRREDLAHDLGGTQATRHDNFYWYGGLDQVVDRELGELVGTPPNYTGITGAIQDESWSYDATGNWQKYGSAAEANLQQTRCHNAANEITRVTNPGGVIQPAYDEVGNQTLDIAPGDWDRGFSLKWDAWNRLIEVNDGNTLIQTNAYDGLSRRITSGDGTDITHYYYNDAWRSVEEYTDADPDDPACQYLWGLRSRWDLVKRERSDSGILDEKRYVLYDAMDPVAICDEDGEVVQRFEYSPFGRTTFLDPAFVPVTPGAPGDWTFLFHGEFRDGDTGYYNYGYRYYNDTTGRWPSRDPIGERGGMNLYGFVGNDGVNRWDYLGNFGSGGVGGPPIIGYHPPTHPAGPGMPGMPKYDAEELGMVPFGDAENDKIPTRANELKVCNLGHGQSVSSGKITMLMIALKVPYHVGHLGAEVNGTFTKVGNGYGDGCGWVFKGVIDPEFNNRFNFHPGAHHPWYLNILLCFLWLGNPVCAHDVFITGTATINRIGSCGSKHSPNE
jgi:RHS repeat-associated protein